MRLSDWQTIERLRRCFSPVAEIQWVETTSFFNLKKNFRCFSPVAGIQWVETRIKDGKYGKALRRFSPVAGIQWVETI